MTMKRNMSIGVAQMDCTVGDVTANLNKIERYAKLAAGKGVDLVIYPECCTTGYFLGDRMANLVEPPDGPTATRIGEIAKENGLHMAVGSYTRDGNLMRNSQLLHGPDGKQIAVYHKAHLFAAEREVCTPGDEPCIADTALGKIGMTICYDLVFPEYARSLVDGGADFLINSTHWFNDLYQRDVWGWEGSVTESMARTRALENVTYVAMAARVGEESLGPDIVFDALGHSCVAAPSGKLLASLPKGEGLGVAHIGVTDEDEAKWKGVATYHEDRRPALYAKATA